MHFYVGKFPVVKAGSFEPRLVELESQWFDQMQLCTGIGAKAYDITGIGRYFRLIENKTEHRPIIVNSVK